MTTFVTYEGTSLKVAALSNTNHSVASTGGQGGAVCTFLSTKSAGKYYLEFTTDVIGGGGYGCGVNNGYSPSNTNGANVFPNNTNGKIFNTAGDTGKSLSKTPANGDVIGVAIDLDNHQAWFKNITQSSAWNGDGTANPATNAGGVTIDGGSTNHLGYVPVSSTDNTGSKVTINGGSSAFVGTVPSGFTSGWSDDADASIDRPAPWDGSSMQVKTGGADRVLVLHVACTGGTSAQLSSVGDNASLTWAKRSQVKFTDAGGVNINQEVWWAHAPIALSPATVVLSFSGSPSTTVAYILPVVGAISPSSPWDSNVSLPAVAHNTGTSTLSATISTSSAESLLLGFTTDRSSTTPSFDPAGLTNALTFLNSATNATNTTAGFLAVSSAQSSVAYATETSVVSPSLIVDAIPISAPFPSGPMIVTEAADRLSFTGFAGFIGPNGFLQTTEAPDTLSAQGFSTITASMHIQEAVDSFSAFGRQPLTGSMAVTEAPDRMQATGLGLGENGTFISAEAPDIFSAVGNTPIVGALVSTERPDRFSAIGVGVKASRRRIFFVA